MSGSSLDGLDIAYCKIQTEDNYQFQIVNAETYLYTDSEKNFLKQLPADINKNYQKEEVEFAEISAKYVNAFLQKNTELKIDFIASHGHTVFHFPEKGKTLQIGDGNILAQKTAHIVINNFRQKDIDAGGQGAPLVPIADEYFFKNYDACLNIGGIANISYQHKNQRVGFDICAANQLLNYAASFLGLEYDTEGALAESGKMNLELFKQLNQIEYFKLPLPKSMDNSFIKEKMFPLVEKCNASMQDKLHSITKHIAFQIAKNLPAQKHTSFQLLVTGGGAFNTFLLKQIEEAASIKIQLPSKNIIDFKEALAMALMAVLRWQNKNNFLPSVSGAAYAVCAGDIFYPDRKI